MLAGIFWDELRSSLLEQEDESAVCSSPSRQYIVKILQDTNY